MRKRVIAALLLLSLILVVPVYASSSAKPEAVKFKTITASGWVRISTEGLAHLELVTDKGVKYVLEPSSEFIANDYRKTIMVNMFEQFPVNKNIAQVKVSGYLSGNTILLKSITINKISI
jgi:hypothetical protein